MRVAAASSAVILATLPSLVSAGAWGCDVVKDKIHWNFKELNGRHEIVVPKDTYPTITNTTWEINPCGYLGKKKGETPKEQCPHGTQVCGVERIYDNSTDTPMIHEIMPIAANDVDEKVTRLKTSEAHSDKEKEGLRVVLGGGKSEGKKQQAIIEFICDLDRTGLEGSGPAEEEPDSAERRKAKREATKEGEDETKMASLQFVAYDKPDDADTYTLRLKWLTKYACESVAKGEGGSGGSSGWGVFTWLFVIAFLGVAAYWIFGSWLNYNRYGARGWDLLPHSDTLRDFPYLLKDFVRKVAGTLQGRSSRGGYSAV